MNNLSARDKPIRSRSNENEETKQQTRKPPQVSEPNRSSSVRKNDSRTTQNTLSILSKCAKTMLEESQNLSTSCENHYQEFNEALNTWIQGFVKYATDYKKGLESLKTNPNERKKRIDLLNSIRETFTK